MKRNIKQTCKILGVGTVVALLLTLCLQLAVGPVALASPATTSHVLSATNTTNTLPGQVVVKFKAGLQLPQSGDRANLPAALGPLFDKLGVSGWKGLGGNTNVYLLLLSSGLDDALNVLQSDASVENAEPNYILQTTDAPPTPNDPLYASRQWHLDRIQAPLAWTITTGSRNVVVAVIDSGIDETHPDLAGKVIKRYDFVHDQPTVIDDNGHGTAVASFITANTNNKIGLAGLNWDVSLLNLKAGGSNGQLFTFDVARAIIFATDNGAQVINGSFGGPTDALVFRVAVAYAQSHNVVEVFAAGNSGNSDLQYPADYSGVISVGATNFSDQVTGFSSFGPHVSLVAPGSGVWAATPGGGYQADNGTSFSSPIVVGVVALMLSVNPNLTPLDVINILEGTADDIGGHGFTPQTGFGRVNAYKAVLAAKNGDLRPNKRSVIKGKVSGIDPSKVRLSLDPYITNGVLKTDSIQPDVNGNFEISGLGRATYQIRAAVNGVGTGQGAVDVVLDGSSTSVKTLSFAFQNVQLTSYGPDHFVDQARFFDRVGPPTTSGTFYAQETGHTISGTFLNYWQKQGGVAVFGFPLSEPFLEVSPTDGKIYTVQYFERNRFELHPENVGTDYEVLLGLLGSEDTFNRKATLPSLPFQPLSAQPIKNATYFASTSHSLSGKFLNYWQQNGGLAIFGYPISEPFVENGRMVQYFERNRFELHPENAGTQYEVLLGLLGQQLAITRGYLPLAV